MDAWVVEILFDRQPPLSERPLSLPAYSPQSIKGVALTQELQNLLQRGQSNQPPSLLVSTAVYSAILQKYGVRMLRYLGDYLILASSVLVEKITSFTFIKICLCFSWLRDDYQTIRSSGRLLFSSGWTACLLPKEVPTLELSDGVCRQSSASFCHCSVSFGLCW